MEKYNKRVQEAQAEAENLLKKAKITLEKNAKKPGFYSLQAHDFLMGYPIKISFPWDKGAWPGEFTRHTGYTEELHFGYAVAKGRLFKASFFAIEALVDGEVCSRTFALDPIDHLEDIQPEYYFGAPVEQVDFNKLLSSNRNPLENFVERQKGLELQLTTEDASNEMAIMNLFTKSASALG